MSGNTIYSAKILDEKRPICAASGLITRRDEHGCIEILLGKRTKSTSRWWAPPGGKIDWLEDPVDALKRELKEEINLDVHSVDLVHVGSDIAGTDRHYLSVFYLVSHYSGQIENLEPEKHESWDFFPVDNLPDPCFPLLEDLALNPSFLDALEDLGSSICS